MMFHLALPELKTLGVMTPTPGLTRSAHVVMCLGFPGRTMKLTMELVTMPLVGALVPRARDQAGLDQLGHVGLEREVHDVGRQPVDHRGGLGARGAEGGGDGHAAARLGGGEVLVEHRVGRLGRRVGHQADRAALRAGRQRREGEGSEGEGADAGDLSESAGGGRRPLRRVGPRAGAVTHVARLMLANS